MAQYQFNAQEVSPESQFTPLPNGEYPVIITESEMKPTKAGDGEYLQLTLEVVEGQFKGRKMWDRLNLKNPNATAVEIAQRALSQICRAVNHLNLQDTVELHHKPLIAKVAVSSNNGYESNDVKEYKAYGGAATAPTPVAPTEAQQPAANQGGANKPAWAQ